MSENTPITTNVQATAPVETIEAEQQLKPANTPISSKFSALAKKEKGILAKMEAYKSQESNVASREAQLAAREAKLSEFESLRSNPMKALESLGLDYNQITQYMLNNGEKPVELQLKDVMSEVEHMKQLQADSKAQAKKEQEDAMKVQEAEVIESFKTEISSFLKTNVEKYELIQGFKQESLVFDTIEEYYTANNKVLSITEASDMVEKYLEQEAEKALSFNKIKAKANPQPAVKVEDKASTAWGKLQQPSKTLTNQQTTKPQVLSEQERINRAMARLRGQI